MNPTKRNYRATFILDNRAKEDPVDQITAGVTKDNAAAQGDVTAADNIGKKDFVRVPQKEVRGAAYVPLNFLHARCSRHLLP